MVPRPKPPLPASRWLTSRDYQTEFNKNVKAGFYPSKVTGIFKGEEWFKAEWKRRPSGRFYFHAYHGMTLKTYREKERYYKSKGFSSQNSTRFKGASGIMKYQATWTKR